MLISWKAFLKLSHDFHFGYLGELEGSIDRLNWGFFFFFFKSISANRFVRNAPLGM